MRWVVLFLVQVLLSAQPRVATRVEVIPQERMVGGLNEVVVNIENVGKEKLTLQAQNVWSAVMAFKFTPQTHVKIREEEGSLRGMSGRRKFLLSCALVGTAVSICDQSGYCRIGNEENPQGWKAVLPVITTSVPVAMLFVKQNVPDRGMAQWDAMVPAAGFTLGPGQMASYVMYGTWAAH